MHPLPPFLVFFLLLLELFGYILEEFEGEEQAQKIAVE